MTAQHLTIEGKWDVTVLYDVWPQDLPAVAARLSEAGAPQPFIDDAADNLQRRNAGYTFSNLPERRSVVCIGRADSLRQFLNTVDHETDHVQAHVAECYGVRLGTEQAAYLQGYIGGRLFEFVISKIVKTLFW